MRLPHLTAPTRIKPGSQPWGLPSTFSLATLHPTAVVLALFCPAHTSKKPTGCSIIPTIHTVGGQIIT